MPEIEVCGEAADGHEAMKIVTKQKPDVLMLGINLKSVGAFRVVRMLRLAVPETEMLAITLLDSAEVADVVLRAGARALITKSDPPEELLQAVRSVRRRHPYVTRNLVAKLRDKLPFIGGLDAYPDPDLTSEEIARVLERQELKLRVEMFGILPGRVATHRKGSSS
jgi:DNA-binding NarL/FixJ family response regulator